VGPTQAVSAARINPRMEPTQVVRVGPLQTVVANWDAAAGANRAFLFSGELRPASIPAEGETLLPAVAALRPCATEASVAERVAHRDRARRLAASVEGASFHLSDQSSANRSSQVARHLPLLRCQSTHPA